MGIINSLVFRPPRPAAYSETSLLSNIFYAETSFGVQIPIAVDLPGSPRQSNRKLHCDQKWILFSHGNAEDLYNTTIWTAYISQLTSLVVVSYDYSGYGISYLKDGDAKTQIGPSEQYLLADAEAVLKFAEEKLSLKKENAVLWGRSLGCSAVCHLHCLARQNSVMFRGIILQSPFTSVLEVGLMTHLEDPPAHDMFRNYDKIKAIGGFKCPCFVIHGKQDWIVNWWHGQEMASLIPDEYQWPPLFPECGHNDLENACERFVDEIYEFIKFCVWRGSAD